MSQDWKKERKKQKTNDECLQVTNAIIQNIDVIILISFIKKIDFNKWNNIACIATLRQTNIFRLYLSMDFLLLLLNGMITLLLVLFS